MICIKEYCDLFGQLGKNGTFSKLPFNFDWWLWQVDQAKVFSHWLNWKRPQLSSFSKRKGNASFWQASRSPVTVVLLRHYLVSRVLYHLYLRLTKIFDFAFIIFFAECVEGLLDIWKCLASLLPFCDPVKLYKAIERNKKKGKNQAFAWRQDTTYKATSSRNYFSIEWYKVVPTKKLAHM